MIIGHSFYGLEDVVWDTAIPTTQLDTMRMHEGIYDEVYRAISNSFVFRLWYFCDRWWP